MADDKDDKTEEPTARRLDEARKRGEIVYSQEVATWIMLAAGAMALSALGPQMMRAIGNLAIGFLANAGTMPVDGASLRDLYLGIGIKVGSALGMFFLVLAIAGIAARMVQDMPTWAPERLKPSLEKLDPIKGFGRIFGPRSLGQSRKIGAETRGRGLGASVGAVAARFLALHAAHARFAHVLGNGPAAHDDDDRRADRRVRVHRGRRLRADAPGPT